MRNPTFGIRWEEERKARWEKLAQEAFNKSPSDLARDVLQEFMASFVSDEELMKLGLAELSGKRLGGLLSLAASRVAARQDSSSPAQAKVSESPPARRTKSAR